MDIKDRMLGAAKCKVHTVNVEDFGGEIHIKSLSVQEFSGIHKVTKGGDPDTAEVDAFDATVSMIIASVVNSDGTPVFAEADRAVLKSSDFRALENLAQEIHKINGNINPEGAGKKP